MMSRVTKETQTFQKEVINEIPFEEVNCFLLSYLREEVPVFEVVCSRKQRKG